MRTSILVTGAAGRVACMIAPQLRPVFRLRRLDLEEMWAEADDELLTGDVRDVELVEKACAGVVGVVHLAAEPDEADFLQRLLPRNIEATWAAFEAAVRAKVPRFVFASSIQTIDGYPEPEPVPANAHPRPVSAYGATKLFGEALGRLHADKSGLGVACLRIGGVRRTGDPSIATDPIQRVWCGSDDLARLISAAMTSDVPFAVVTAVSHPAASRFDTANPFGWVPIDRPSPSS